MVGDQRGIVRQDGDVDGFMQAAGNLQHRAIGLHRTAACLHPLIERQGIADALAKSPQIVSGIEGAEVA